MQLFHLKAETNKMMLVQQDYHRYLTALKQILQDKNSEQDVDDAELSADTDIQDDTLIINPSEDLMPVDDLVDQKEEVDQQDTEEQAEKFQFISADDEKQLNSLRKRTQRVVTKRKKVTTKSKLLQKQMAHLQKISAQQVPLDFTFHWPLELHHFWISSLYGARKKADGSPGFHAGIDLAAMKGTPVKTAAAGVVIQAQYLPGYGNNILIQHNKYYRTRYAHLHTMNVSQGQSVAIGQKIGTVGATGFVRKSGHDASHLHFEIYHNGSHVNPLRYLFN